MIFAGLRSIQEPFAAHFLSDFVAPAETETLASALETIADLTTFVPACS